MEADQPNDGADYARFLAMFLQDGEIFSDEEDDEYDPHAERLGRDQEDDEDDDRSDIPSDEVQDLVDDCRAFVYRSKQDIPLDDALINSATNASMMDQGYSQPMIPIIPAGIPAALPTLPSNQPSAFPAVHAQPVTTAGIRAPVQLNASGQGLVVKPSFHSIEELRQLIARQMSMNFQLMVQMLLMSDNRSEAFSSSYKGLLELRNHRDEARKRSALLQFEQPASTSASSTRTRPPTEDDSAQDMTATDSNDTEASAEHQAEERMTRGRFKNRIRSSRCSSLFDMPGLENIESMFHDIDKSKRSIGTRTPGDARQTAVLEEHVRKIVSNAQMKPWNTVLPSQSTPTPAMDLNTLSDPFSLTSRNYLTPAQERLLLRGLITYGEDFDMIQKRLLPFQSKEQLKFQYTSCAEAEEDNIFKRYKTVMKTLERQNRRWSNQDDAALVRGFQEHGSKWTTIKMTYLPYRSRKEMQKRWQVLKKRAVKAAQKLWSSLPPATARFLDNFEKEEIPDSDEDDDDSSSIQEGDHNHQPPNPDPSQVVPHPVVFAPTQPLDVLASGEPQNFHSDPNKRPRFEDSVLSYSMLNAAVQDLPPESTVMQSPTKRLKTVMPATTTSHAFLLEDSFLKGLSNDSFAGHHDTTSTHPRSSVAALPQLAPSEIIQDLPPGIDDHPPLARSSSSLFTNVFGRVSKGEY